MDGVTTRIASPWRALRGRLQDVPVADDVDRRNAPTLQIVLLMLAALPSAAWLYRAAFSGLPWRQGEFGAMLMSLALCAIAVSCFVLIRRGRFQFAVRLLLVAVAATLMDAYATQGFGANRYEASLHMVWLILAGLMAGRRALWLFYLWLVLALAVGVLFDLRAQTSDEGWLPYVVDGMIGAAIFLFVAVVVDRSSTTLRQSLAAARALGDELARAKARLEAEIAERERIHEQLIHSQKVEVVGRLAAGVAHDFNHLLTLIIGYAAQGRSGDEPARLRELLGNIDAVARRASLVSRRLTGFSRRDAAVPEVFDVNRAIEEMQPSLHQLLGPDVRVVFAPSAAAQAVRIDRSQFELVVLNIAANAGEAMPEGGRLVIEVHALDTVPAGVELCFSDSGHGMDEATRQRVFEPFFTTRAAGCGTGLGLAVAADVIAARGGRIAVESAPGRGATFRVQLPLAVDDVEIA